jgi:hypothetical protein
MSRITESIQKVFKVAETVQGAVAEDSAGGKKVTIPEAIGIGIDVLGLVPVFKDFALLVEDWKTRDATKKAEWIATFKEEFDLPDDQLEQAIEALVSTALLLESSFIKK